MYYLKKTVLCLMISFAIVSQSYAQDFPHPDTYRPSLVEMKKHKKMFDDPTPLLKTKGLKQILPPELYEALTYDIEEMKTLWSDVVGFKAPDVVGKIAPEIKPGKYTYQDVANTPQFKELLAPYLLRKIAPAGPPMVGNIEEFEIVPTRQYYWAKPISEATKKNEGKVTLDEQGYYNYHSWEGGYPFPKPSGKFKAQQIMFNVERRYDSWGGAFTYSGIQAGFDKKLSIDFLGPYLVQSQQLAGRVILPPYGWFDDRAREGSEYSTMLFSMLGPRDVAGTVQSGLVFLDPDKVDQNLMHIPSLRRIRKMSATDTQDPVGGQDNIYDDQDGWHQKLTPNRYPYSYKVISEREYLVVAPSLDGAETVVKETGEFKNVKLERRPMWVVEMTQLDPNYVYSKRLIYVDQEMLTFYHTDSFDQKGRLYRTFDRNNAFLPEFGMFTGIGYVFSRDYIDTHSSITMNYLALPSTYTREDMSMSGIIKRGK